MTYQAAIAQSLEQSAAELRSFMPDQETRHSYREAAKVQDSLAAQFRAGDYDNGLMEKYAALAGSDRALDVSKAAEEIMSEIGFENVGCYLTPDDVLDEIINRANRA